jgi:hypothetical protein
LNAYATQGWESFFVAEAGAAAALAGLLLWTVARVVSSSLGLLPLAIGGVSTVLRAGGGLYWLAPGVILSFGAALLDAWVLLIEIQR